ncbi:MAG TPA: hypothetical protein PLC98_15850, partial [Anaerolineales bacterium]|nr:hypothetical protein [Anaerolineales bacterium]
MGEEAKLRVVLDAENKGREEVEQFEAGLKGVGEQAEQTHKELGKAFDVDALVEDAVLGLEVANDAFDDQAAIVNRLAKAQHDLEAKALRLADAQLALAENTDPKAQHELEAAVLDARVALDEQTKSVDKLAREYVGLDDHTTKATSGFDDLSNVFEGLTGMSLSTTLSIAGLVMVLKEGLEIAGASTERYLEYTEQVRGLSDAYSLSARQASTLVQVLDDARVKPASVETAFRKMAENGIQPSIENLADLSERFESIRNPIEKAAFLSDQFGQRAGPEMAKLLALGKTSILEYAEAARDANLTLTAADLAAAERLKAARDELADAQTRLDITVGPLLANLSTAFTWVATEVLRGFGVAVEQDVRPSLAVLQEDVVDISGAYEEMSAIGQAAFDGMLGPIDAVAAAQAAAEEAQKRLNKELGDLQMLLAGGVGKENKRHAETMGDLTERAEELRGEMDKLTASNGQYYEYTTDSSMSANELALAQYNLAEAQAELSKETDPGKQLELAVKVEHLQEKVSGATTVVSGYIDNSKKIGELSAEYDEVTAAIDRENAAHVANTRSFMFNLIMKRAAMDDFKTYSLGDLGALAARWGLLDEDTAKTMGIVDEALTAGGSWWYGPAQARADGAQWKAASF